MPSIFAYQSAEVDWCEGNFEHSEYIAEYYNTISNVAFFILAPLLMWLNSSYRDVRPIPVHTLFVIQFCIGAFSLYFHMTLSYVGQLLDELSILWGLSICYAFWFPVRYFPGFIKNREQFIQMVIIVTIVSTLMSFVRPALNAYALNCIAFHLLYLTVQELRQCKNPRVHRLAASLVIWWLISISCWLVDKFLCNFCQKINFCYLHSFWHIFINVTIFYCATLVMYFDVLYEMPNNEPVLTYWPSETSFFALPYILVQKTQKLF
ncbi:alkaline ceramidase 1 [Sceloporus undulatus]|uniref:alkaline ceramidase 1 n=1 Tax=Sceloporus undulatus TaxID=8520 RepID=UPI001C4DAE91|nr:alkaline ceramidase 1 [Sceloporus undulatus]